VSEVPAVLSHLFAHDYWWLAQFVSLLFLPFAHEDLAIVLGAYIVVNKIMPAAPVALCLYGGMVASDFALYSIGAGARHLPWLTRFAINDRIREFGDMLKRNLFGLVALCRIVPGVVFVAFIACGWSRVSLARFTAASLVVSALYLPLMLCIVVFFGDALDDRVGIWTWPLLIGVLTAIGFVRRRVFAFRSRPDAVDVPLSNVGAYSGAAIGSSQPGTLTLAQRIALWLIYLPLLVRWLGFALRYRSLTLPTVANPGFGVQDGRWDEPRSAYLRAATAGAPQWIANFVVMTRSAAPSTLYIDLERARQLLAGADLAFPLVAKPDVGRGGARRVDEPGQLREYLRHFPAGEKLILQRIVPEAVAATALYARLPGATSGRILSLTLRQGPTAGGRGHVCYRDARRCITPELEAVIDAIARMMPEFHYGRFDLRFASPEELMRGKRLSIIEINGMTGAAKESWDPSLPLGEVYRRMVEQQRIMFLIGDKNRARGFTPIDCADVVWSLVSRFRRLYQFAARRFTSVGTKGAPATL
jgi:membrane protein DedA with SNARE-associated domain